MRAARRVRRAGRGNPPGAILAGRPGLTPTTVYQSAGKKADGLVNLYCWAHIRRYFVRAGDANPGRLKYWTRRGWTGSGPVRRPRELTAAWKGAAAPAPRNKTAGRRPAGERGGGGTARSPRSTRRGRSRAAPAWRSRRRKRSPPWTANGTAWPRTATTRWIGLDNNIAEKMIAGPVVPEERRRLPNGDTARKPP